MAGADNGDPRLKEGSLHGVDFSLRGPVFVIGEVGLRTNYKKNSELLSGNLKIGGYYNGGSARLFAAPPVGQPQTERGRVGFYVVADQGLLCWGDPTQDRHLGIFGGFTVRQISESTESRIFSTPGWLCTARRQSVPEISYDWL